MMMMMMMIIIIIIITFYNISVLTYASSILALISS